MPSGRSRWRWRRCHKAPAPSDCRNFRENSGKIREMTIDGSNLNNIYPIKKPWKLVNNMKVACLIHKTQHLGIRWSQIRWDSAGFPGWPKSSLPPPPPAEDPPPLSLSLESEESVKPHQDMDGALAAENRWEYHCLENEQGCSPISYEPCFL